MDHSEDDPHSQDFGLSESELRMALLAPGQGALSGLVQLLRELESILGVEAVERVRAEAIDGVRRTGLSRELVSALTAGLVTARGRDVTLE